MTYDVSGTDANLQNDYAAIVNRWMV